MRAADRPTVTDDARVEAMSRYSFGTYHGQMVQWHDAKKLAVDAFIAGAEWAVARAETTTDLPSPHGGGCGTAQTSARCDSYITPTT